MNRQNRTRISYIFLFIVLIGAMPNGIASASVQYGDIVVSLESSPTGDSYFGYAEYKIQVTNGSVDSSHKVTVSMPFISYSYGDNIKKISRTFVVSPASTASVSIFQPPLAMQGQDIGVAIDGVKQKESINLSKYYHCPYNYSYHFGWAPSNPVCILISRSISFDDFQNGIDNAYSSSVTGGAGGTPKICGFVKSDTEVQNWSSNWLSFSRYEGVVVSASDCQAMPVSVRDALLDYVCCGGSVFILGRWEKPEEWIADIVASEPFDLSYVGFGVVAQCDTTDVKSWSQGTWRRLKSEIWTPTSLRLQGKTSIYDANKSFAVVSNLTIPVRGLFLLVLLFAVVIGPVNLFVLSYKKRRIWMLWTVPLISVVASLAVFSYAFFAEGWKGYERISSVTILNERTHRAASIAIDAFYCPLTPRQGLHFSYETEVTLMGIEEQGGAGRDRTVDWTSDQHFDMGWVAARVPAHFLLRKSQVKRERLKISRNENNDVIVVNGLGTDISKLYYADNEGKVFTGENIKAGEQKELIIGKNTLSYTEHDIWRKSYSSEWNRLFGQIQNNPARYLKPDSYIAVIDKCIFIEEPLTGIETRRSESVVFGFF